MLQYSGWIFKTGCLAEASFPSNKQSAGPDFLETGWKYSSHIISTSRILELSRPWGSAARPGGCGRNLRPHARQKKKLGTGKTTDMDRGVVARWDEPKQRGKDERGEK